MQRARTYMDLRRAATSRIKKKSAQQWSSQGKSPISYLQEPERLLSSCMLLPEELVQVISVTFTGGNREAVRSDKAYQVSVTRLRAAFEWLVRHNPHWSAFGNVDPNGEIEMSKSVQQLLIQYQAPDGSESAVVPEAIVQSALPIDDDVGKNRACGPVDAVLGSDTETSSGSDSEPDLEAAIIEPPANQESAASLWASALTNGQKLLGGIRVKDFDFGSDDLFAPTPKAEAGSDDKSAEEAVTAVVHTASILGKFHHGDVQKELEDFRASDASTTPRIVAGFNHSKKPLNTFDPEYWAWCFTDLAPYGDCPERVSSCPPQDKHHVPTNPGAIVWHQLWEGHVPNTDLRWVQSQITRVDYPRWRLHLAFLAVAFFVMQKRAQMRGLAAVVKRKYFKRISRELDDVPCEDLYRTGQILGDYQDVKSALCHKDVPNKVKTLLRQMQLAQQNIPYTADYRRSLHRKFTAMRVYHGCSMVFFTLNPADTKHTFTISFACPESAKWPAHVIDLEADDDAQAEFRGRLTSLQIHEVVANDPVAATRCFHTLVTLVITALLNCTIDPKKLHPDGIASGDLPGVLDHLSSFCGVVEPQMRKALHLHALLSALGFSTPEDLRSMFTADFDAAVKKLWKYIASLQFTSPEAYAVFLNEESAMQALRIAPLVPYGKKQLDMIGPKRALDSNRAQLEARGMTEPCRDEDLKRVSFPSWQPDFFGDSELSASEYAERSCEDNLAATLKVGNHSCIPEVCHKGRVGRQGFCRMNYWFWAWIRGGIKKKDMWKRFHGKRLVPRWCPKRDSHEQPPIDCVPPNVGKALTEQTQQFVTKSNPAFYGGPRCNHDVGPLVRVPIDIAKQKASPLVDPESVVVAEDGEKDAVPALEAPRPETVSADIDAPMDVDEDGVDGSTNQQTHSVEEDDAKKEANAARADRALSDLATCCNDADYYCSDYSTKEQPRLVSLWITLSGALKRVKEELRDTELDPRNKDVVQRAKRCVFRLMTSCTQGMQKGMPEMVSFLLGLPEFYCSHAFASLYLYPLVGICIAELAKRSPKPSSEDVTDAVSETFSFMRAEEDDRLTFLNQRLTYSYRPPHLVSWPLYFFVAGTIIHRKAESKMEVFEEFLPEHPQATTHYITMRAHIPWVIPEIIGSLPPSEKDNPFLHALILLILFVPWRDIPELLQDCAREEDVVALFQEKRRGWKAIVEGLQGRRPADVPSEEAFAYKTLRHIDNLELMSLKRDDQSVQACSFAPSFGDGVELPEDGEMPDCSEAADFPHPQMGEEDGADELEGGMSDAEEQGHHTQKAIYPVLAKEIKSTSPRHDDLWVLAAGSEAAHGTKKEEAYIKSFLSRIRNSVPAFLTIPAENGFEKRLRAIAAAGDLVDYLAFYEQLKEYFAREDSKADAPVAPVEPVGGQDVQEGTAKEMARRAAVCLEEFVCLLPSLTIVFQAAMHLVEKLLLTHSQAIAFLHFARWVQELKVVKWAKSEKWNIEVPPAEPFLFLILGAGGCGKSTLLLVSEVFVCHWLGSEAARKVAIANSVARRIGGDTMHAVLKLPMSYLGESKSLLKGETLQQFRKGFDLVKVLFVDECSMVACVQWFQADLRCKQAKREFVKLFGGMALAALGDLLQLPPVKRASVCDPKPAGTPIGVKAAAGVEQPKGVKKKPAELKEDEHIGGYDLWREFATVTTLRQNVRAKGALKEILEQFRSNTLTDANWLLLQSRLLGTEVKDGKVCALPKGVQDKRLSQPPFSTASSVQYVVHRHSQRAVLAYQVCLAEAERLRERLYVAGASDHVKGVPSENLSNELHTKLYGHPNFNDTECMPGAKCFQQQKYIQKVPRTQHPQTHA